VTHTHEAFGDYVEQEAANEFVGLEGHGLFSVLIFSVPVTEGNLCVMGRACEPNLLVEHQYRHGHRLDDNGRFAARLNSGVGTSN
jgi:hypothetical protein